MAGKPKLFRTLRRLYQNLGIYSPETNQTYRFNWKIALFASSMVSMFITSVAFLLFEAETLDDYGTAFYGAVTQSSLTHNFLMVVWRMPIILKLLTMFENIIESRASNPTSQILYDTTAERIERMFQLIDIFIVKTSYYGIMIPPLLTTAVNYFVYDLKDESFLMPRPMWVPFNWKTPVGYLAAWIFQSNGYFCILFSIPGFIGMYIGLCWLFVAFAKDIANDLPKLNAMKAQHRNGRNHRELKARLCHIVQLHSDMKEFMREFNVVCEFVIFVGFCFTLLTIGSSLIAFFALLSEGNSNSMELISPLMYAFWSFAPIFMYCEFGNAITDEFAKFNDELYSCKWYSLPIELQKMVVIFIAGTQEPFFIRGFCNVVCTRDSFKKTSHVGFSYFMTLNRMNG